MSGGALSGLRVLELGTLIAGPFAARMFAEFGAEVIKVEDPVSGDPIPSLPFPPGRNRIRYFCR